MGFLDKIRQGAEDAINSATDKLTSLRGGQDDDDDDYNGGRRPQSRRGGNGGYDDDDDGSGAISRLEDKLAKQDYDDILNDDIKPQRSDILEILGIPENYEIPDDVLLVGDLSRVKFDMTEPSGYSTKMVDAFYDTVSDSLVWYRDALKKRNRDIAKLATQLDKSATDLHNAKLDAEMSDGLTVMTGQQSTAEQEVQELQLTVVKLRDENDKLKRMAGIGKNMQAQKVEDTKYEELQNQLGMAQLEIKKLTAQLKRQNLTGADASEDDYSLNESLKPMGLPDDIQLPQVGGGMPSPAGNGMPMPGSNVVGGGGMPMPMGGRSNAGVNTAPRSMQGAVAAENDYNVNTSTTGLQGGMPMPTGNGGAPSGMGMPNPMSMPQFPQQQAPRPNMGGQAGGVPSDDYVPLPDSMNRDDYDDLNLSFDDGGDDIDMSKYVK